ncbi:DNA polymerase nu-like isoform X2 [Haliotis rubra]|uniref:DNA polymerase nu-like isoform X2 n=1 Tax=Haliotis rubra TaxID=36100 RepID=UPI001EE58F6E|nr:DNA polymerase nu-like isoform X2 [Haliotis rubra]
MFHVIWLTTSSKNQCLQRDVLNPSIYSREQNKKNTFLIHGNTIQSKTLGAPVSAEQTDKMEDRNMNTVVVISDDKQSAPGLQKKGCQSHIDSYFQQQPCSVARKLEINKQMREAERKVKVSTTLPGESDNTDKIPRIPDFCKAKKSKICGKQTNQLHEDYTTVGDASVIEMQHLSEESRNRMRQDICSSQFVCISLVYSDNTTSVRCFQPAGLKLKFVAMKAFTLKSHPGSSVALFSCTADDKFYMNWFKNLILDIMENNSIEKIVMNGKQVCIELLKLLEETWNKDCSSWKLLDPVVGSWLLNSDKPPRCLQDVIKESGVRHTISVIHDGVKSLDSDLSLLQDMMTKMRERLWSHDLWGLFCNIETCLIPLLAQLEMQRFKVNTATFVAFSNILKKKLTKLEEKAFASAGHSFCINSHPQLRQVLYEELRLDEKLPGKSKIAKTTVAHQKSTSEATLTQLKDTHALPAIVLEYRQLQKLKSTYVDGMASCVRKGYLSTHWDQTAAATGRLTSSQPNIQAIPKVPVTITDVQDNFIVDFQQIELRLLAHLADDQVLLGIFNNPQLHDIFIELTSQWLGKSVDEVSPPEREQTKRIVYSVMYGVGKEKLADYLKVSSNDAKAIMTSFLTKFPAVNSFTKKCVEFCQQHGFTHTIFKRKRLIPHINHPSPQLRAQAGRQAVNFCVQGSAADLCKAAMLQVQSHLNKHGMSSKVRLLAQIHDELLYEVQEEHLDKVKGIVKDVMEDSRALCMDMAKLNVPIRVTLSTGTSWAHLQSSE